MELDSIKIFVKIVQAGSFSKAANMLKLPKSTVSRAVSRLENESGTKLLLRTTRNLTLTPSGKLFYDNCVEPLQTLEDARKSLQGNDSIVSGNIRITAPEDLGNHVISPFVSKLIQTHPDIHFELNYSDEIIDLVKEGFDIAIRLGKLNPSSFKTKKLGEVILIPVASPSYLKDHEKIKEPQDLSKNQCVSYNSKSANLRWNLSSKKKITSVNIHGSAICNQMSSLVHMALKGAGVALAPSFLCEPFLKSGQLVRILPEWNGPSFQVSMVSPLSLSSSSRMKIISGQLGTEIQKSIS